VTGPREPGSAFLIRLVAAREISARIRDRNFLISSAVLVLLLVGIIGLNVALGSGDDETRLGLVGGDPALEQALESQGGTLDVDVTVVDLDDEEAARAAVEAEEVDAALLADGDDPELLVQQSADGPVQALAQGVVAQLALAERLAEAGVTSLDVPEVAVRALDPDADADGQRIVVAMIGVGILYSLLILFGQFVAQGVVEEKASRVVELLLATMRPWQLLAGKVLGLGVLGLGQIVLIAGIGVGGALAFDLVDIPGELVGTAVTVVAWFVLGYALYASLFAVAASLVSRQEDLGTVLTPMSLVLIGGVIVGFHAAAEPAGPRSGERGGGEEDRTLWPPDP